MRIAIREVPKWEIIRLHGIMNTMVEEPFIPGLVIPVSPIAKIISCGICLPEFNMLLEVRQDPIIHPPKPHPCQKKTGSPKPNWYWVICLNLQKWLFYPIWIFWLLREEEKFCSIKMQILLSPKPDTWMCTGKRMPKG